MNRTLEAITAIIFVCILAVTVNYTITEAKKSEEFRTSQEAIRDSLLSMDTVHIKCVRCNWDNYRTLLWFKDSIK